MALIEHPFAQYVRILGKGKKGSRSLSYDEAYTAFTEILHGRVEDLQLGAFLMLLRVKEESAEEIAGFVQACRDFIAVDKAIPVDIDWSSYAGKRRQLPWFIAVLTVLSEQGYRIFIHGAKGHTAGRLYLEEAFSQLNLPIAQNFNDVARQLDQQGLSLMPINQLCSPLSAMLTMRNTLGLRSPVHTLTRLINPLNAPYSFQSVFHPAYADTHKGAAQILGQQHMVVFKGEGGEIERKPNAASIVKGLKNNTPFEEKWSRLQLDKEPDRDDLDLQHFVNVYQGRVVDQYAENTILGTLALALKMLKQLDNQEDAFNQARLIWAKRDKSRFISNNIV